MLALLRRLFQIVLALVFGFLSLLGVLSGIAIFGKFQEGYVISGPLVGLVMVLLSLGVLKLCWDNLRNKAPDEAHLYPEREFVAGLDPDGTHIQVSRPDGTVERLAIEDLSSISIVTNASGPWGVDVWWVLENAAQDAGCIFPMGATGEKAILEWAEALPGFDSQNFIEAMGCTSEARFVCWSRLA